MHEKAGKEGSLYDRLQAREDMLEVDTRALTCG